MKNKYNIGDLIAIHKKYPPEKVVDLLYIKSSTTSEQDCKTTYGIYSAIDQQLFGIETEESLDSFFTAGTFTISYKHYVVVK